MIYNLAHNGNKLITFTIDGTTYQAIDGMTWGEWVNSKYNTIGAYIQNEFIYAEDKDNNGHIDTSPSGSESIPKFTTKIISDGTYYITGEIA